MWLIYFNDAAAANDWKAGSHSADSGSRLAAIEPIAGISLLSQAKRINSSVGFPYQPLVGSLLQLQVTEAVSSKKCGKISAMNVNRPAAVSSLQRKPLVATNFGLSGWNQLFQFKEQVRFKFEN
jgi:hypothetical protein